MNKYESRNCHYFIGALLSILISNIFAVYLQFFKGDVLDYALVGDESNTLRYGVLLLISILCEILFYFVYRQFSAKFVIECTRYLKQDVFGQILQRNFVSYKECSQGEYIAKYTNEVDAIKEHRFNMLPMFWDILFKIVIVSIALFLLDPRIAIITIALLTTPLYVPKLIEKPLQKAQTQSIQSVEETLSKVNDWLSGFEIIKNYSIEAKILVRFQKVNDNVMDKSLKERQLEAVSQLISTLISYLSYFIVLVCSAWLVWKGEFSAGNFFVAIGMIDQLSYPLISLTGIIRQLIAIKPVCNNMELFLTETKVTQYTNELQGLQSDIHFNNVSFGYNEQNPILSKFNFTIKKGGRYLIQGPSGCGKTTIINLLLRYYDVDKGEISIDGTTITNFSGTYGCITVVRQEANLFHDTLRNNLTMYSDIEDEKLLRMLSNVGLKKLANIKSLDSMIEEGGANFSGGEKKRISLARALLRNTDILILDEPLANLDIATAEKIEDVLLAIENKTILIVSHQFTQAKLYRFDKVIDFSVYQ